METTLPKGILIPIGGGSITEDILERIIAETGKKKPRICYINIAMSSGEEAKDSFRSLTDELGEDVITSIYYNTRKEADSEENIRKVLHCNAVLIGGGNQLRLSCLLGGTVLMSEIRKRYYDEHDFVIAGNSAGAAAMSNTMIISGSSKDALVKGELQLTNGLGLINDVFVDTHLTERGRFGRLIQTVAYNPGILGLGLSADTAAVIYQGEELEVIGSGLVVIVDGTQIEYSNVTEIADGEPITIEGLKMHVLGSGKCFLVESRKMKSKGLKNYKKPKPTSHS